MLFVVIFIGFFMLTIGVALLFMGEVPFLGGKRIPATRSRLIGVILVTFLPLALLTRKLSNLVFDPDAVHGLIITGLLFVLCWMGVAALLLSVLLAKPDKKGTKKASAKAGMFEDAPIPTDIMSDEEPAPKPAKKPVPTKKASSRPAVEENPFDFS